ncbi:HAMP domain-containing sensor histidine kinase [Parabacteroides gordonii]|jgi:two-component system phosphate regulon sensor histidine kinase PhoR|uniref:sensor histidine kinase n=1 Tax=Parabacteroides gordonii TaxID=574930 RepID=UPI00241DEC0D|nr:HAMP domain-containing sensor histidine kinase [Parabacteroides gordonii]
MRINYIWTTFIIAVIVLLLSQFFWLHNMYHIQKTDLEERLNIILVEAVQKELDKRFLYSDQQTEKSPEKKGDSFKFFLDNDKIQSEGLLALQNEASQRLMVFENNNFDLSVLDSIYNAMLEQQNIEMEYYLCYRDSMKVLDSLGDSSLRGIKSKEVPIVNDTKVQAIFSITMPLVLSQMLWMLVVSVLMFLLIIICFVYELRVIFTQRRLTQLRDDFSHALVHDMKTPLGTIYMAVDQWGKGVLDKNPELRSKFSDTAMAQVLNLQALVDKILTIAYLEQKKLILDPKIMDLSNMIQGLVDKFSIQTKKPVSFKIDIDLESTHIIADPVYLTNAVSNLIDNAIKYSGDSVAIDICCHSSDNQLFIEVSDNGFGISERDREKIFEKFERGAAVGRKGAKGFGLGLNYVKRVMNAHGGTVSLSSLKGQGSKFVLYMPLKVSFI